MSAREIKWPVDGDYIVIPVDDLPKVTFDENAVRLSVGFDEDAQELDSGFRYSEGRRIGSLGVGLEYPTDFLIEDALVRLALARAIKTFENEKNLAAVARARKAYENSLRKAGLSDIPLGRSKS